MTERLTHICLLSWSWHLTISSSVAPFRSCPQSSQHQGGQKRQLQAEGKILPATSPPTNQKKATHPTAFTSNFAYKNCFPKRETVGEKFGKFRAFEHESPVLLAWPHNKPSPAPHSDIYVLYWFHCALGTWNQFSNNFTTETSLCMLSLLTHILGEINYTVLRPIYNPLISVSSPRTFQALYQGCISLSWPPMHTGIYQFQTQFKHQLILKLFLRSLPGRNMSQNTDSTLSLSTTFYFLLKLFF